MSSALVHDTPPPNPAQRRVLGMHWARRATTTPAEGRQPQAGSGAPNDLQADQWGLHNPSGGPDISLIKAWETSKGDRSEGGPIIAFLDTGVDLEHPDLKANLWTNHAEIPGNGIDDDANGYVDDVHGCDALFGTGDPSDDNDHGTHTAGIAAAVGDNGLGITGVMQQARVMPVKMFANGWLSTDQATERAMAYAKKMGAKIVNHSWGGGPFTLATLRAFASFPEALHVVAAGNLATDNDTNDYFPGNLDLDNVIVVAASDRQDGKLPMSQYGAINVDVAAPGEDILSTVRGGYGKKSATSFATPHVTGIAGLIASAYPELTPLQIKERILFSSDRVPALQNVSLSGGRVNAAAALEDDRIPPAAPQDFEVAEVGGEGIKLRWLTPADDAQESPGADPTATARVEVRVLDQPITEENYNEALAYLSSAPTVIGQPDFAYLIGEAQPGHTLYFGAKAIDNVGNRSSLVTAQARLS